MAEQFVFNTQGIQLVAVDPNYNNFEMEGEIIFFKTDHAARMFRLNQPKNSTIYLNELPDPECKQCNGTGNNGMILIPFAVDKKKIIGFFVEYIDSVINLETLEVKGIIQEKREILLNEIIINLKFPESFKKALGFLVNMVDKKIHYNLSMDKKEKTDIAQLYVDMIWKDFQIKKVNWCSCIIDNLEAAITDLRKKQEFSIN